MKKILILSMMVLMAMFANAQPFNTISDGESGLSVRTNLNNLINYTNALGWKVQFSSDKEGWHDNYAIGDFYVRLSTDFGDTYTDAILIFDGQTVIDSLDMNNNGIINMQAGINDNDAVTLKQMMDSLALAGGYDSIRYNEARNGYLRAYAAGTVVDSTLISTENLYFSSDPGIVKNPTVKNVLDHVINSYVESGAEITDLGDGTIEITAGEAILKIANSDDADLRWTRVPADTLAITEEQNIIVYIDYNGGSPMYGVRQSTAGYFFQNWDKLPIATVVNTGDEIIINNFKSSGINSIYKNTLSQVNYDPMRYLGGLGTSEVDTRKILVSAGAILNGNEYDAVSSINTNTGDTFTRMYYTTGSGWTRTPGQTTVSNSEYNSIATGLATLTSSPERWANKWLYYILNEPSYWILIEGQTAYESLAAAQAGGIPAVLPPEVNDFYAGALLVAKIIVSGNSTNFVGVQNPFTTVFQTSAATSHNNLSDLQAAGTGITHGHITDQTQTLYGQKSFMTSPIVPTATAGDSTLKAANTDFVLREIANNTFLYTNEEAQDAVGGILDDGTTGDIIFAYDDITPKIYGVVEDDSHNHIISNVDGLQDALNAKQATITGAASTVVTSNLTGNMALISNSSGKIAASASVSSTELGYLDGVTSGVQGQIDALPTFAEMRGEISDSIAGISGESLWNVGTGSAIYYDDGVVGIGTSTPGSAYSLHNVGNSFFDGNMTVRNNSFDRIKVTSTGVAMPNLTNASKANTLYYDPADGNITYASASAGGSSPLTTKGDLYTYTTGDARLPVGTNGQILSSNSATTTGLEWIDAPSSSTPWTDGGTELYPTNGENIYVTNNNPYIRINDTDAGSGVNGQQYRIRQGTAILNIESLGSDNTTWTSIFTTSPLQTYIRANLLTNDGIDINKESSFANATSGSLGIRAGDDDSLYVVTSAGVATNLMRVGSGGGTSMVYPGAGIAVSDGSQWVSSITNNSSNWNAAYNDKINSASFNASDGVITLTQQDAGTVTVDIDGRYITGNQSITLSGDITGSGTTAITTTIGNGAVEAIMLNNNIISGKDALTSGLASTDELMVSDAGTIKRMDVSVLEDYMQANLSFGGGGVTFGADNQIPYTNSTGTGFDYSANLTFDGTSMYIYSPVTLNGYESEIKFFYNSNTYRGLYTDQANYNYTAVGGGDTGARLGGSYNVYVGGGSGMDHTSGTENTGLGYLSLGDVTTGTKNTAVGSHALAHITTQSNNVAFGQYAGRYYGGASASLTSATKSTYIGSNTRAKENTVTNETVIGYNALGNGSNTVTIGNTSVTGNFFNGDVTTTGYIKSDQNTVQSLSGSSVTMNMQSGHKGSITLAGDVTFTITNLPDGGEGQIDIVNPSTYEVSNFFGSTGYTTRVLMGRQTNVKENATTTLVFWRTGSTLYYGYIHAN